MNEKEKVVSICDQILGLESASQLDLYSLLLSLVEYLKVTPIDDDKGAFEELSKLLNSSADASILKKSKSIAERVKKYFSEE